MPYKDLNDLPKSVLEHLPKHAQEIYRAAFNSAWEEYAQDEERAHWVAWDAEFRNKQSILALERQ